MVETDRFPLYGAIHVNDIVPGVNTFINVFDNFIGVYQETHEVLPPNFDIICTRIKSNICTVNFKVCFN